MSQRWGHGPGAPPPPPPAAASANNALPAPVVSPGLGNKLPWPDPWHPIPPFHQKVSLRQTETESGSLREKVGADVRVWSCFVIGAYLLWRWNGSPHCAGMHRWTLKRSELRRMVGLLRSCNSLDVLFRSWNSLDVLLRSCNSLDVLLRSCNSLDVLLRCCNSLDVLLRSWNSLDVLLGCCNSLDVLLRSWSSLDVLLRSWNSLDALSRDVPAGRSSGMYRRSSC